MAAFFVFVDIYNKMLLMARNLLYEMAVHSESDVFNMNPVASVSTEATNNLEGKELRRYVYLTIQPTAVKLNCNISEDDIGVLIRHHCGYKPRKKAALLALPYIVSANLVTAPWRKQVDKKGKLRKGRDRRPSGMISAPIMIDGVKYLCNITNKTNLQGRIALYALTLKDGNGNIVESEKMVDPSNVPHSNSEQSANGNVHINKVTTSHESNPSFQGAKVQQNIETNNNNDIKTENIRMNKKQIRLTESDLKQIVKESVSRILNEAYGTPSNDDKDTFTSLDRRPYDKNWSPSQWRINNDRPFENTMKVGELINELGAAIQDMYYKDKDYYNDAGIETKRGRFMWERGENTIFKYQDLLNKKVDEMQRIYDLLLNKLKQTTGEQPKSMMVGW